MSIYAILGRVVLENEIIDDGLVVIDGNKIAYAGRESGFPVPERAVSYQGKMIGPGFVDIHCHAGNNFLPEDEPPETVIAHMLKQGTTGMLITFKPSANFRSHRPH